MRKRKKYFGIFNIRKRMQIHFADFEISYHKGLYVRISVIGATVTVNETSIYFFCTKLYELAVRSY